MDTLSPNQLFQRMEGLYHALARAVEDPIVVPNSEYQEEAQELMPFDISKVYFYAEEEGLEIMRSRINISAADLIRSYHAHKSMCRLFSLLEENASCQDAPQLLKNAESLCQEVEHYSSLIAQHQLRLGEDAFLEYPHFRERHMSYRNYTRREARRGTQEGNLVNLDVRTKIVDSTIGSVVHFNLEATPEGIARELHQFRALFIKLPACPEKLWSKIYAGNPEDAYQKKIELTRMLLQEHCGFEVEP